MVMASKVILRVKEKIESMVRDVTTRGSNVFDVRGGASSSCVPEHIFKWKVGGGSGHLQPSP